MAGTSTTIIPTTNHHNLNIQEDPSKFYYHNFLYKFIIVAIFLLILPLFPSQPPQFILQSLLTRNWELLHLLLAGIAISYGLLISRRNDDVETHNKEHRFHTAQSYLFRFLQLPSVFEDEEADQIQTPSSSPSCDDESKIQTWSSSNYQQHHRNEALVVVASESCRRIMSETEKPLLLPIRSLKSSCVQSDVNESSAANSSSVSRRFLCLEEDNNVVVPPSPIPWRSESSNKIVEHSCSVVKSQTLPSCRSNSMSFASSESLAKNAEDVMKKKGFHQFQKSYPPPPPPMMLFKSISMRPRTSSFNQGASFDKDTESDEDDDDDDDDVGESLIIGNDEEGSSRSDDGNGGDVDKKADEFIAKFREQIRLQRIDSIKRTAAKRITTNSSR